MKEYGIRGISFTVEAESPEQAELILKSYIGRCLRAARYAIWAPFTEEQVKKRYYAELSSLLRKGFRVIERIGTCRNS